MPVETLLVLVAAFGAGVVDAMAGGGGLIQLPALFAAYPTTPHPTLLGTGKLAGLAGTTYAARRYLTRVQLEWKLVLPAAAGAFAAALVGAWIATRIPPVQFRALVPRSRALAAAGAGTIGLYDGFFGPGTGSFLVFLFVRAFGLDFLHASASAKVVNAAANLAAILLFGLTGQVFWLLGLAMAACNVAGAHVGSHLAIRHGSGFVRNVFIAVVSVLIAKTAWDALALSS